MVEVENTTITNAALSLTRPALGTGPTSKRRPRMDAKQAAVVVETPKRPLPPVQRRKP